MTRFQKFILCVGLLAPMGMAQNRYVNEVLALNPLGYWRLNGDASDATANANNGILVNGLSFTGSGGGAPIGDPSNQAGVFNSAQDQYITLPATASAPKFALDWNHPLTMMIWAKTTYNANNRLLLAKQEGSGNFRGFAIYLDNGESGNAPSGAGRFGLSLEATVSFGAGSGNFISVETLTAINDGNWHFLVGTYDGSGQSSGVKLYIDGALQPTVLVLTGNSLNGLTTLNTAPVNIGARGTTDSRAFNGLLSEAAIFGAALTGAQVQQLENDTLVSTKILPQWAFGGGWYSAVYFTNMGASAVSFPVSFTADDATLLTVPALGGSSTTVSLAPRGTALLEAPNSGPLSQGYVSVSLPGGVAGYGVFRQSVPGIADQEAVVPFSGASSTSSTLIWDDTNFVTTVAITNPSSVTATVAIVIRDSTGATIGTSSIVLAPKSKKAAVLMDLPGLAVMKGNRGSADFTVAFGNVAVLGLRFGGSAFTSIPTADR